ncbi:MAG: PspA-associated protein PspAA [Acidimicrobiales bacterium]
MIVRILGDTQYELPADAIPGLEHLDVKLNAALERGDEAAFAGLLEELVATVRSKGAVLDADKIVPSELTVPHEGSTIDEVRSLLASEKLEEA